MDKRTLLKYEEIKGEFEKRSVRRLMGIGAQSGAELQAKKSSQIYGFGHGLRGWFGEDVQQQ